MYFGWDTVARWLSWLKRLTSNEEIPSSNLGRAFLFFNDLFCRLEPCTWPKPLLSMFNLETGVGHSEQSTIRFAANNGG